MTSRWLREITYDYNNSTNSNFWRKAYALFLRYVCDFTFQSESVGAGRSWVSTEKNGTNGAFSGSSYSFTDTVAASFVSGDADKFIVINDSSNPENGGIYRIDRYVSATEIEIDFVAGYQEYPLAGTGISWWIVAGTYESPTAFGEYVRLQSRHSTGWAVELKHSGGTFNGLTFRVATNGDWGSITIGNFSGDQGRYTTGLKPTFGNGSGRQTFWAEVDYDGEWAHFWQSAMDTGSWSVGLGFIIPISIERIQPIELGLVDDELIALRGPEVEEGFINMGYRYFNYEYGRISSYCAKFNREVIGYPIDYTYGDYTAGFATDWNRGINNRRDEKWEAIYGTPFIIDENNISGQYHLKGYLTGHWTVPNISNNPYSGGNVISPSGLRSCKRMLIMDMAPGTRNRLYVVDGTLIKWPGWSILNIGRP